MVKWLAKRKDIDPRRIAVAGHSEGGAVAMLAAAREKKIGSLVLIAATGSTRGGADPGAAAAILDLMKLPDAERQSKIELQQRMQAAVVTDKGWESIPPELRAPGRYRRGSEPAAVRSRRRSCRKSSSRS